MAAGMTTDSESERGSSFPGSEGGGDLGSSGDSLLTSTSANGSGAFATGVRVGSSGKLPPQPVIKSVANVKKMNNVTNFLMSWYLLVEET
jgi:hypothetical protein